MNSRGLTLIEVLIALVVISIALTAIIKSTSQTIKNHIYLEDKIIAAWIANNKMNEIRAGLIHLSLGLESIENKTTCLNKQFSWKATRTATANSHIQQINMTVLNPHANTTLVSLTGYLYVDDNKN